MSFANNSDVSKTSLLFTGKYVTPSLCNSHCGLDSLRAIDLTCDTTRLKELWNLSRWNPLRPTSPYHLRCHKIELTLELEFKLYLIFVCQERLGCSVSFVLAKSFPFKNENRCIISFVISHMSYRRFSWKKVFLIITRYWLDPFILRSHY